MLCIWWEIIYYEQRTKPSMPSNTMNNLIVCGRLFSRSAQDWPTGGPSITIMPGHTHLCAPAENYLSFFGMFCRIFRSNLVPSDYHLFRFLKNSFVLKWWNKFSKSECHQNLPWAENLKHSGERGFLICPIVGLRIEQKDVYIIQ